MNNEISDTNEEIYKDHIMMRNNTTVGKNCLTFSYNNARYKIYNKFVHSLELKSNSSYIGNNIQNWCNNLEKRLRETFKNV